MAVARCQPQILVVLEPLTQQFCTNSEYQELDFLLGDWSVDAENGQHLGYSTVTSDMEGCVLEEDFGTAGDYASQSFFGWDFRTSEWYRVHIDTEGVRLLLSGGLEGSSMVLTGSRPRAGGKDLYIRMVLTPEDANHVTQTWETSKDGISWTVKIATTRSAPPARSSMPRFSPSASRRSTRSANPALRNRRASPSSIFG